MGNATNNNLVNDTARDWYGTGHTVDQLDQILTVFAGKIALGEMSHGAWGCFNALLATILEMSDWCTGETEGRSEIKALAFRAKRVEGLA